MVCQLGERQLGEIIDWQVKKGRLVILVMGQRRKLGEIDNWLEVALGDWGRAKVGGYSKAPFGRREWNGIKGIFLKYSSLSLFGSFNGGNGRSIPLFGSLSGREWNG